MNKKNIKKCSLCHKEFEVYPDNPQKKYCSGACWCAANGIDDDRCKHYLGGHKQIKRKKNATKNKKIGKKKNKK